MAGLGLLVLWAWGPFVATVFYNNIGSVVLNRALLASGPDSEAREGPAVVAGRMFQTALAWDPLNAQAYHNLGDVYEIWQDTPSAARALSRAVALNPRDASAHFRLGQILMAQGREEQALEEWREASAADYLVNRGLALAQGGDHAGAIEQYRRALSIDPDLVEAHYRLGQALGRMGRREEARAALEAAAALEPASSPRRYLLQAELHTARGEWSAALAAFRRAAELSPQDPGPYYQMGWILNQKLGDEETAIGYFQWALRLDPDYVPPRLALGRLYGKQGRCDEAARWLSPLLSPRTRSAKKGPAVQAHTLLATCRLEQGREEEALAHLEQAAALNPDSTSPLFLLARTYSQVGRYQDALATYLRILELDPDNAEAVQALEELGWLDGTGGER